MIQSIFFKKKFLIIDDLSLNSQSNIFNFILHPELVFFFKYLAFIYLRSKTKKLFYLYVYKIILKKKINFFIFLNEQFFLKNLTLFNRFKLPKIGFITQMRHYPLIDYPIYSPAPDTINQRLFYCYFYSVVKLSLLYKFKASCKSSLFF